MCPREPRHVLTDAVPRERRVDGPEFAANPVRCLRFGVPHVEVARTAIEKQQDTRVGLGRDPRRVGASPRLEQLGQRDAEQAKTADLQQMPS